MIVVLNCIICTTCRIQHQTMGDVAKDLTAGTVGGAANLIVGHPFDTIKVKLQSQPTPSPGQLPKYSGAIDAVKQTIAAERPRGLYKGMGAPLATVAAFNALLFAVRGQMEALLRTEPSVPLTPKQQVVAGAGAGFAVSFLACPTELIKCRSDVSRLYLNYLFWQLQYSLGVFFQVPQCHCICPPIKCTFMLILGTIHVIMSRHGNVMHLGAFGLILNH
jgi:hypothetical protein